MEFDLEYDLTYLVKCPEELSTVDYVRKSSRRVIRRVKDHNRRDKSSHMFRHSIEKNHTEGMVNDFKNNVRKRKVTEALLIKQF